MHNKSWGNIINISRKDLAILKVAEENPDPPADDEQGDAAFAAMKKGMAKALEDSISDIYLMQEFFR